MENKEIIKRKIKGLRPYNHIEDTQEILYRILGIVGEGGKVEVDNKTITLSDDSKIQLGEVIGGIRRIEVDNLYISRPDNDFYFGPNGFQISETYNEYRYNTQVSREGFKIIAGDDNLYERILSLEGSKLSSISYLDGQVKEGYGISSSGLEFHINGKTIRFGSPWPQGNTVEQYYLPIKFNGVEADYKGEVNIPIPEPEVKVDNVTISKGNSQQLQLGVTTTFPINQGNSIPFIDVQHSHPIDFNGILIGSRDSSNSQLFDKKNLSIDTSLGTITFFEVINDTTNYFSLSKGSLQGSYKGGQMQGNASYMVSPDGVSLYDATNGNLTAEATKYGRRSIDARGNTIVLPDRVGIGQNIFRMPLVIDGYVANSSGKVETGYKERIEALENAPSTEVKTDNRTISLDSLGQVQLGVDNGMGIHTVENYNLVIKGLLFQAGEVNYTTYNSDSIDHKKDGKTVTMTYPNRDNGSRYTNLYSLDGKTANEAGEIDTGYNERITSLENAPQVEIKVDGKTTSFNANNEIQLGGPDEVIDRLLIQQKGLGYEVKDSYGNTAKVQTTAGITFGSNDDRRIRLDYNQLSVSKGRHLFVHDFNTVQGDNEGGSYSLSRTNLSVKDNELGIDHAFNFPKETEERVTTMFVDVNNTYPDDKGHVELDVREHEYEYFMRYVVEANVFSAVYKYDRLKMGSTIGDLFHKRSKVNSLLGSQPIFDFNTEELIMEIDFGTDPSQVRSVRIPDQLEGKTFVIGKW